MHENDLSEHSFLEIIKYFKELLAFSRCLGFNPHEKFLLIMREEEIFMSTILIILLIVILLGGGGYYGRGRWF